MSNLWKPTRVSTSLQAYHDPWGLRVLSHQLHITPCSPLLSASTLLLDHTGPFPPQPTCRLTLSLLLFKRTDYSHDSGSQAHFRWHLLREFFFYPPFIVFTPSPISPFPSLTTSWNHLIITVVCFQQSPPTECMLRGSGPVPSSPILGSPAQCLAYSGHLETNWLREWMTLHIKKKNSGIMLKR